MKVGNPGYSVVNVNVKSSTNCPPLQTGRVRLPLSWFMAYMGADF